MIAAPAMAQDVESDDEEAVVEADNAIVVTGFRAALESAQNIKRDADTFVDAITAEDIGALPDRSVSEALQRVPGVNKVCADRHLSQTKTLSLLCSFLAVPYNLCMALKK